MKKIFTILASVVVAFTGLAAEEEQLVTSVTVNLSNGTKEYYALTDAPEVKLENRQLIVTSPTLTGTYDFADVSHVSFEKHALTGIDEIVAPEDAAFMFAVVDNHITVSAPALEWVKVFSTGGAQVASESAGADHVVTIDISGLAPGIYIVTPSCHEAIKIVKQ